MSVHVVESLFPITCQSSLYWLNSQLVTESQCQLIDITTDCIAVWPLALGMAMATRPDQFSKVYRLTAAAGNRQSQTCTHTQNHDLSKVTSQRRLCMYKGTCIGNWSSASWSPRGGTRVIPIIHGKSLWLVGLVVPFLPVNVMCTIQTKENSLSLWLLSNLQQKSWLISSFLPKLNRCQPQFLTPNF